MSLWRSVSLGSASGPTSLVFACRGSRPLYSQLAHPGGEGWGDIDLQGLQAQNPTNLSLEHQALLPSHPEGRATSAGVW